jgi:hypothetical protein
MGNESPNYRTVAPDRDSSYLLVHAVRAGRLAMPLDMLDRFLPTVNSQHVVYSFRKLTKKHARR